MWNEGYIKQFNLYVKIYCIEYITVYNFCYINNKINKYKVYAF